MGAEEMLGQNVGKVVNVNCHLGHRMSDFQEMMYAGKLAKQNEMHYFVRSLERVVDGREYFNGVYVISGEGYVAFDEDSGFTLHGGSRNWPKSKLSLDEDEFRTVKDLWDACMKAEAVGAEEVE